MASDWEQRQLCPDGGCVGLIGGDGTCKVCGRAAPGWGDERARGLRDEAEADVELEKAIVVAEPSGPEDFEDRALCPDGACIGLIGDDGACRVCGKRADAGSSAEA
jgi:hypothetical protein